MDNIKEVNKRVDILENTISNLEVSHKNLDTKLTSFFDTQSLYNNHLNEINNLTSKQQQDILNKHKELEEKCHHMYSIKEHLFSTLALFFGIFTLISIDIGLTKSIFSSSECLKNHHYSIVCLVAIVILQIIFCSSVYLFLVKPFLQNTALNKSNEKNLLVLKKSKGVFYVVVLIISAIIIASYLYNNSKLVNKINNLETEITSLKSTTSTP